MLIDTLVALSTQIAGVISLLWTAYQEFRHMKDKKAIENFIIAPEKEQNSIKKSISQNNNLV
jgi:hypothetical protein